jgi:hypothetical protein
VNGAGGALRISNGQTIENNIFINHWGRAPERRQGPHHVPHHDPEQHAPFRVGPQSPASAAGGPASSSASRRTSRAVLDNNVIAFSDNDGIKLALDPAEVVLTNNVFSHNQWSHVNRVQADVIVDAANWKQAGRPGLQEMRRQRDPHGRRPARPGSGSTSS